jgi:hypothetical protein
VFSGEGFISPPSHDLDTDAVLAAIVGLLSSRPGDTEAGYFDHYTRPQMTFAEERGEELAQWASDLNHTSRSRSM